MSLLGAALLLESVAVGCEEVELLVVAGATAGVPMSVLLRVPMLPSWRCSGAGVAGLVADFGMAASVVGKADVEDVLAVVGFEYGLDAAFGELLLGTELVCAMLTPAVATSAATAAMLKVLGKFFISETP